MDVISQGRSSYFHVKEPQALRDVCAKHNGVQLYENKHGFYIVCDEGLPQEASVVINANDPEDEWIEDFVPYDVLAEIADLLVDGGSIIYEEISYEGSHSVGGWSTARDNTGKFVNVDLADIQHKMVAAGMALPKKLDY